jgi:hypothetical protein
MVSIQKEKHRHTHTRTHTTLSFNYICQLKLGNKSTKKESERLTLLTSGHGDSDGVTPLENKLVSKTGESHCRQILWQEMWPHDGPWMPPALHMSTQSPEAGEPSCWETKPTSSNNWWSLWAATGLQGPLATVCPLGWASYLQPPSLGSPHLQMTAPSAEWCSKKLGYVLGTLGKGEGEETQALGVSSGTFHSSWQSMNRVFLGTRCLRTRVGQGAMLFP